MGNLTHYYTSRIDIKNNGTYNNKIEILSISDDDAKVTSPKWFSDEKGNGIQIQSSKGFLDLKLKIVSDGLLNIDLRSLNVNYKRDKSLKVPIFIEYTSLKINGVESLKKYELVSHDDKYVHNVTVKNGEIIFVHLEWEPFKL